MRIPKKYGQSKIDSCPFCSKTASVKNSQGVPVCPAHRDTKLPDLKCSCGGYLDIMEGKYGAYFNCMNCGNINFNKGLDMNPPIEAPYKTQDVKKVTKKSSPTQRKPVKKQPKEITITSDQVDVFYR